MLCRFYLFTTIVSSLCLIDSIYKLEIHSFFQVGDEILSVNGNLFGRLTHDEAVSVLKSSHRLSFLVRYMGKVPHSSLLPKNQRIVNSQKPHETQGTALQKKLDFYSFPALFCLLLIVRLDDFK